MNEYLLSIYHVSRNILGAEDSAESKIDNVSPLIVCFLMGDINKQTNKQTVRGGDKGAEENKTKQKDVERGAVCYLRLGAQG